MGYTLWQRLLNWMCYRFGHIETKSKSWIHLKKRNSYCKRCGILYTVKILKTGTEMTKSEYNKSLKTIESLMNIENMDKSKDKAFMSLISFIEEYEDKYYHINESALEETK